MALKINGLMKGKPAAVVPDDLAAEIKAMQEDRQWLEDRARLEKLTADISQYQVDMRAASDELSSTLASLESGTADLSTAIAAGGKANGLQIYLRGLSKKLNDAMMERQQLEEAARERRLKDLARALDNQLQPLLPLVQQMWNILTDSQLEALMKEVHTAGRPYDILPFINRLQELRNEVRRLNSVLGGTERMHVDGRFEVLWPERVK